MVEHQTLVVAGVAAIGQRRYIWTSWRRDPAKRLFPSATGDVITRNTRRPGPKRDACVRWARTMCLRKTLFLPRSGHPFASAWSIWCFW